MSDLNEAAFARLTKLEYAAIHLRVPRSGNEELDAMIREAQRNDLAARCPWVSDDHPLLVAARRADAMLKEGEK